MFSCGATLVVYSTYSSLRKYLNINFFFISSIMKSDLTIMLLVYPETILHFQFTFVRRIYALSIIHLCSVQNYPSLRVFDKMSNSIFNRKFSYIFEDFFSYSQRSIPLSIYYYYLLTLYTSTVSYPWVLKNEKCSKRDLFDKWDAVDAPSIHADDSSFVCPCLHTPFVASSRRWTRNLTFPFWFELAHWFIRNEGVWVRQGAFPPFRTWVRCPTERLKILREILTRWSSIWLDFRYSVRILFLGNVSFLLNCIACSYNSSFWCR